MTTSLTLSSTFTIINARYLTSKVSADMYLCAAYYGKPGEDMIRRYAEELAQLLNGGYVREYEFGFKRDDKRVVSWRYTVTEAGIGDSAPGRVVSYADVTGARFYNYLTHNQRWFDLSEAERTRIEGGLPISRTDGVLPSDGAGAWVSDRTYSSNGMGLNRWTFRP